jgi:hypothetical protein
MIIPKNNHVLSSGDNLKIIPFIYNDKPEWYITFTEYYNVNKNVIDLNNSLSKIYSNYKSKYTDDVTYKKNILI